MRNRARLGRVTAERDEHLPLVRERATYVDARVARIRAVLESAGTNLHHVSAITRQAPYGDHTDSAIPHWFYSELERGGSPHICQVIALSQITGYRLSDWMSVFGYRLDDISRLQAMLPREEPILLSPVTYDKQAVIEWFEIGSVAEDVFAETQPLSQVLGRKRWTTVQALERVRSGRYAYVRVGDADDSLYPRVGAGSVVRIDLERTQLGVPGQPAPLFAVEWRHRLLLTFLKPVPGKPGVVVLPPRYPALEQVPGCDLTIVGTADCELRPLRDEPVSKTLRRHTRLMATIPRRETAATSVGAALRHYRERAGLNLRQAHALTAKVAELCGDESYAVSQSCLFRYELATSLPRHIPKIISLCSVYGMSLWELLAAAGVPVEPDAGRPMFASPERGELSSVAGSGEQLVEGAPWKRVLAEVPLFLREALPTLLGQRELSLDTTYTCVATLRTGNPLFQGAFAITVDPRQRNVERVNAHAKHREPMFLVRTPSGKCLSGACSIQNGTLTVQPRLQSPTVLVSFPRDEVEVLGRITGVVRLLPPDTDGRSQA